MAGKSGGAKNGIFTGITLFIIAGFILGWAHINSIRTPSDVYDYFHALSNKTDKTIDDCGANKLEWNCKGTLPNGQGSGKITLPGGSGNGKIHLPGGNGDGKIHLPGATGKIDINPPSVPNAVNTAAPSVVSSVDSLKDALGKIKTEEPAKNAGYKRSEWRHWIGDPCNTRDTVLMAQGKNVKVDRSGGNCKITSGEWESPYDGKKFTDPSGMDIDHMIPLGYAATHGGQAWSPAKKQQFANDTTQLTAVSANANRSKGDKGPSEYMPRDEYKCQYAKTWVSTATKYGVFLAKKDKDVLSSTLKNCQ